MRGFAQHGVRPRDDGLRRAVIGVESDVRGKRMELARKMVEVVARGAGERVDCLRRVAHNAHIAVRAEPAAHQPVLQRRDVLVFVDCEPAEVRPHLLPHFGVGVEDMRGHKQDVVEIDLHACGLLLLVLVVDTREGLRVQWRRRRMMRGFAHPHVILRRNQRDLAPVDLGMHILDHIAFGLHVERPEQRGPHQVAGRFGQHRERPFAHIGPHGAQLVQRGGVERGDVHVFTDSEVEQTRAHLLRCLDRERDRERTGRLPCAACARVCDSTRDRARLARAGACDDAHRSVHAACGPPLCVVEPVKNLIRRNCHGPIVARPCARFEWNAPACGRFRSAVCEHGARPAGLGWGWVMKALQCLRIVPSAWKNTVCD